MLGRWARRPAQCSTAKPRNAERSFSRSGGARRPAQCSTAKPRNAERNFPRSGGARRPAQCSTAKPRNAERNFRHSAGRGDLRNAQPLKSQVSDESLRNCTSSNVCNVYICKHAIRWRPYRVECTGSLPTSEVKRRRARLVLGWGTAREDLRVLPAFRSCAVGCLVHRYVYRHPTAAARVGRVCWGIGCLVWSLVGGCFVC